MKVYSFVKSRSGLEPVEVEVTLLRGLPKFRILGLPDNTIKESEWRIRSALTKQGYSLPKAQQVVVQIKPTNTKKTSLGVELAIACAYLWESGQIKKHESLDKHPYIYGEIGLNGEIYAPDDLTNNYLNKSTILTGHNKYKFGFPTWSINFLNDLKEPDYKDASVDTAQLVRPKLSGLKLNITTADIAKIIATGEHNTLLAGPAGSGKTTLAEAAHTLLRDPSLPQHQESQQINWLLGSKISWRPLVSPHHSTPTISMLGGGNNPRPGEISRAHGGVLLLDELLEFKEVVKESLREPIEKGSINVSRAGHTCQFPADFLLMATTNLCPCGDLVPDKWIKCSKSLTRCRSYLDKLSGPLLDRFAILTYSNTWQSKENTISMDSVFLDIKKAQEFALTSRNQLTTNSKLSVKEILESTDDTFKDLHQPFLKYSYRRQKALLQVARTIADLDACEVITGEHIKKSMALTINSFKALKKIHN